MDALFNAFVPVVALIAIGYMCRRRNLFGAGMLSALNSFVVMLALPCVLFAIMSRAELRTLYDPGALYAYGGSMLFVFGCGWLWSRCRARRNGTEATIDGLSASYANVGFLGLPLVQLAYGDAAMTTAGVSVILTACLLFTLALAIIELDRNRRASLLASLLPTARALARNPMVLAPLAGLVVSASGVPVPVAFATLVDLLAAAASPAALVALGLFIAEQSSRHTATSATGVAVPVLLKMGVQPTLAWTIAGPVLQLDPATVALCVLLALMPAGTGGFMLAERYGQHAAPAARAVLLSTAISVFAVAAHLLISSGIGRAG